MESDSERKNVRGSCICNEDNENPVTFKYNWGTGEITIVDQQTYLGVELPKYCSWDARIAKVVGKEETTCRQDGRYPDRLASIH